MIGQLLPPKRKFQKYFFTILTICIKNTSSLSFFSRDPNDPSTLWYKCEECTKEFYIPKEEVLAFEFLALETRISQVMPTAQENVFTWKKGWCFSANFAKYGIPLFITATPSLTNFREPERPGHEPKWEKAMLSLIRQFLLLER